MGNLQDDGAPIVQLLLTVSFVQAMPNLTVLDLADIARLFESDLPVFRQIVRAGPMSANPDDEAPVIPNLRALPRISVQSPDLRDQILFQEDRLSFGWSRTSALGQPHDYPGFNATLNRMRDYLGILGAWASARQIELTPSVGEAIYTDAFPINFETPLSNIFTHLNPNSGHPITNIDYSWQQEWPTVRPGHIFGTFGAPAISPDGMPIATLETTARFALSEGWDGFDDGFIEAHGVMTKIFEGLVNPAARAKLPA